MSENNADGAESSAAISKSELQELLGPRFTVESFTSKRLTQPGDNYFSNIQALEVKLLPDHRTLSLVAKLPPVSAFLGGMFPFARSVMKEMRMYIEVAKVFQEIQLENNVPVGQIAEFFPKCYGANASYDDDKPLSEKSALLMENLVTLGYRLADRIAGLDFMHTDLVVTRLARFHASAVAVKIKKPLVFKNVILPACEDVMKGPPPSPPEGRKKGRMEDHVIKQLENIKELNPYLEKLKKLLSLKPEFAPSPKEPFASIRHGDFWTNNMMFKYSTDDPESIPTDVKFVDFQMTSYDSPVKDLIFFLYGSTQLGLVSEHYSHFVSLYHEHFVDQLLKLGCDIKPFSYDALKAEIDRIATKELNHCILMANVIRREKADAPDIEKINSHEEMEKIMTSKISVEYAESVIQLVTEFSKKGWL